TAVEGFTSYSNRIGLAAGLAKELYHEGYIAKRMEAGAVVAAAPLSSVRRERPASGDVVVLLGGPTGRDGIGGATGSSKTHDEATVVVSAAEVQKGNPPEERKIVRMFRNPEITGLIKRCNDFGAGGVSVAVGELADGLDIELDAVPVKYEGLDGTEIALSESQERMAVVVAESDLPAFLKHAESENAPATVIAKVTEEKRLVMRWRGKTIVDIARDFLDINGADRYAAVRIPGNAEGGAAGAAGFAGADGADAKEAAGSGTLEERLSALAGDLGFCSQKGIAERFDSTVGAASVFVPYGGKYGLTETQVMAALLPKEGVSTASVMSFGFDPYHTEADPFGGSVFAVVSSVAKLIASGVPLDTVHLSLQEFFPSLGDDPHRWGLPFSAMLGAFSAQMGLGIAAIGGKDSMSGSFGELDVPPTLISFAIGVQDAGQLISPEFKEAGHPVYLLETPMGSDGLPDYAALQKAWSEYAGICRSGKVLSAWACEESGVYGGLIKMALGNMIGFTGDAEEAYFSRKWGSILFEAGEALDGFPLVGYTQAAPAFSLGDIQISLDGVRMAWESTLEGIFPTRIDQAGEAPLITDQRKPARRSASPIARPKAVLPIFPSTFSEYDTAAAITRAGGTYEYALIRNLTPEALEASVIHLAKAIADAQMVVFPGGFSGGDDPDGAGRYIAALFRHPRLSEAVHDLLQRRDGLILGIGNGFQALLKLGLLPSGAISPAEAVSAAGAGSPGLATNQIGRHQGKYVSTRVASVLSPWLSQCRPGEVYLQPVSYGEGRFVATDAALEALRANGQIAFQYVDHTGAPSMDVAFNPGGSVWAVEGVSSPDGRVLGKMAHPERDGRYVAQNIPGVIPIPLFAGGVHYFA
ncbi:MAG: phosphoribosylformylglycinamidine synthase subunit PurQ, partial [Clostridiales bacterium]|nr:phosphoribosylformylglycinamidine synthase subunit PurQ [Clostridiales bacterium]